MGVYTALLDTDALVLKHQVISIHSADQILENLEYSDLSEDWHRQPQINQNKHTRVDPSMCDMNCLDEWCKVFNDE